MHRKRKHTTADGGWPERLYRRPRRDALVEQSVTELGNDHHAILPLLQKVAASGQPLSAECLGAIADVTQADDARVAGIASFYSMLPTDSERAIPIRICDGPACTLHGACKISAITQAVVRDDARWRVDRTSCLGLCDRAPAALVGVEACGPLNSRRIRSLLHGWRGPSPSYGEPLVGEQRIAMSRIGRIDPASYASARRAGAYQALEQALGLSPETILDAVERSGLRGCGGAGFSTAKKWRMVAASNAEEKYVICNADESEPGALKDRVLMEGDPHLLLEGITLAAYAVGASRGMFYVRGEYETSALRLERAIVQAKQHGWLGEGIGGSCFSLELSVHRGAGAYICGEETALLESLAGRRGEPRLRPPYPTTVGYRGRPTVVNNVETLCRVPAIVRQGGEWYRSIGAAGQPGTKMFALSGHVRRTAVFESRFGNTTGDMINSFGLGMRSGSGFKLALTGGAAGTLIPAALLDIPLDMESLQHGVALGSGVVMAFDTSVSAVQVLEWLLRFFRVESCGKCTPCREGTVVAHELVKRIADGKGRAGDMAELDRLAKLFGVTSFCGLGQSIEMPINSALAHFAEDFRKCGAT